MCNPIAHLNKAIKYFGENLDYFTANNGFIEIKFDDCGTAKIGKLLRISTNRDLGKGILTKTIDIEMTSRLPSSYGQTFVQTIQPEQVIEVDIVI